MKTIEGDLVEMTKLGKFDVIVHGCNCFCTMRSGFAKGVREHFYEAVESDCQTKPGDKNKLGNISIANINRYSKPFTVVNAYTQYTYGCGSCLCDYGALRQAFRIIKKQYSGKSIAYPMIGAGLAGGDWNIISSIIEEELCGENHTLIIFKKD